MQEIPPNCIIALLPVTALTGRYTQCGYRFANHGVQSIKVNIGGQIYPSPNGFQNIMWEGDTVNFLKPYFSLFEYDVKINEGCLIQPNQEYYNNYCMYRFFFGYKYSSIHDHIQRMKIDTARLIIDFSALRVPTVAIAVLVITERPQIISINSQREILRDFIL